MLVCLDLEVTTLIFSTYLSIEGRLVRFQAGADTCDRSKDSRWTLPYQGCRKPPFSVASKHILPTQGKRSPLALQTLPCPRKCSRFRDTHRVGPPAQSQHSLQLPTLAYTFPRGTRSISHPQHPARHTVTLIAAPHCFQVVASG